MIDDSVMVLSSDTDVTVRGRVWVRAGRPL
jgi:hypothetical protein